MATSPMGTLCFWAMYPRKEKTTKPEEKLVRELTEVVMTASLGNERHWSRGDFQLLFLTHRVRGQAGFRGVLSQKDTPSPSCGLHHRKAGAQGDGTPSREALGSGCVQALGRAGPVLTSRACVPWDRGASGTED